MIKRFFIFLIRFYRSLFPSLRFLFPFNSCCIYFPTCSQYTEDSIKQFGALTGLWLGLKRILSCHPFAPIPRLRGDDAFFTRKGERSKKGDCSSVSCEMCIMMNPAGEGERVRG